MDFLILQPQFQLMVAETASVLTAFGTGLVPATPSRPSQHMGDGCRFSPDQLPQEVPHVGNRQRD